MFQDDGMNMIEKTKIWIAEEVNRSLENINKTLGMSTAKFGHKYVFDKEGKKHVALTQEEDVSGIITRAQDLINEMLDETHKRHVMVTLRWVNLDEVPKLIATDIVLKCYSDPESIAQMADEAKDMMPKAVPERVEASPQ